MSLFLHRSGILAAPSGGGGTPGAVPTIEDQFDGNTSSGGSTFLLNFNAGNVVENDLIFYFAETSGNDLSPPTGYTMIKSDGQGTPGGDGSTRQFFFYKIAGASESAPVIDLSGVNHFTARGGLVRGVDTSAPVNVSGTSQDTSASTTVTMSGVTTTRDNCLVWYAFSIDNTGSGAWTSGWTNSTIDSSTITEWHDNASTIGIDGGMAVGYGTKATAGATGTTTATIIAARVTDHLCIAIQPPLT